MAACVGDGFTVDDDGVLQVAIDPDPCNTLEQRDDGLYVPGVVVRRVDGREGQRFDTLQQITTNSVCEDYTIQFTNPSECCPAVVDLQREFYTVFVAFADGVDVRSHEGPVGNPSQTLNREEVTANGGFTQDWRATKRTLHSIAAGATGTVSGTVCITSPQGAAAGDLFAERIFIEWTATVMSTCGE